MKKEVKGGRERVWRDRIVRDWDWDCQKKREMMETGRKWRDIQSVGRRVRRSLVVGPYS
jgi:hypothetical protein